LLEAEETGVRKSGVRDGGERGMMMFWVEIVDADGKVLLTSGYLYRKHAEAKQTELQKHPILQSHPGGRVRIKSEMEPGRDISK